MLPAVLEEFLAAVNDRDAARVAACFTDDASYAFLVPHPAVEGRAAIEAAFARVLGEVTRMRWEVVTAAVEGEVAFLERVDRFWFGDHEAAIECTGVFVLSGGLIAAVRDYADHQSWTQRKQAALHGGSDEN